MANRMAIHFKNIGLDYGDFVVLQMPNTVHFYYLLFGLARIGVDFFRDDELEWKQPDD